MTVPPSPLPEPAAPRGPSILKLTALLSLCLAMLVLGVLFARPMQQLATQTAGVIAGMWRQDATGHDHAADGRHYTCGMHPWVILPQPGDCPICHMALVPLDPAKFSGQVAIDPAVTQRLGVRTAPVVRAIPVRHVRTVGEVTYDETALHDITLKYTGWIEQLHVNAVGQRVAQGQPLFEIRAPEVYVAQQEYLHLWRRLREASQAGSPRQADDALSAARRRLLFFGMTTGQIEALEQRGHAEQTLAVLSPADGVVTERHIALGSAVTPDALLYRVADLSRVWVLAAVYEDQLALIDSGTPATMTLPAWPGRSFPGRVEQVYPYLDAATRQARARLAFANPDGRLKPGMFAAVTMEVAAAQPALLIPRDAVLDTGVRQRVFIDLGDGLYEPREVKLGQATHDGQVQVLDGLAQGDLIVTSGQFLLDGEANLRQALAQMLAPPDATPPAESRMPLTPEVTLHLNALLDAYLALAEALAQGQAEVAQPAGRLASAARALEQQVMPGQPGFWQAHPHAGPLASLADRLTQPHALADARLIFRDVSQHAIALVRATGVPADRDKPLEQLACSMYLEGDADPAGGDWITPVGVVRNPYFGAMMLRCYTGQSPLPTAPAPGSTPGPGSVPESVPGQAPIPGHGGSSAGQAGGAADTSPGHAHPAHPAQGGGHD